ncbi:hypothetical protein [Qipengyuania sphaerica]|nr:hypothetical protein [Qipengyuania sphaerica]MBX7539629.1 hypothetical protein [Qipengyuania sphaerica]
MSKQLTLSATFAVLSTAALALVATLGTIGTAPESHLSGQAPMGGYEISR